MLTSLPRLDPFQAKQPPQQQPKEAEPRFPIERKLMWHKIQHTQNIQEKTPVLELALLHAFKTKVDGNPCALAISLGDRKR